MNEISKETIHRLLKDIKEIMKQPLHEHGIYYKHDDTDLLKGKALIIGPQDTPYANGFYLFDVSFPNNYPYAPPKLTYKTNDGSTRFNPNLYKCGKVCLSILNTWRGEQWSSCQTISSLLLVLCTVLNEAPLLNEPGITKTHIDYVNYNAIIKYKNIEVAILGMLTSEYNAEHFVGFLPIMQKYFIDNFYKIINVVEKEAEKDYVILSTGIYQMIVGIDYICLKKKLVKYNDEVRLLHNLL